MNNRNFIQTQHQEISHSAEGLRVGPYAFQSIQKVIWHEGLLNFTGKDEQGNVKTLEGLSVEDSIERLEAQRRRSPNAAIISKCLGLAQLSTGEAALAENRKSSTNYFQESISSLERACEQEPGDPETTLNLTLAYCYAEDLETEATDDYAELVGDLLEEVPLQLLPQIAAACAIRGEIYFNEGKPTLGFNFLKQELFLWRHRQLLDIKNVELQQQLNEKGKTLIGHCEAQGWRSIAEQLTAQLSSWISEPLDADDTDSLDPRLVEAAEFERAGKAYISHDDKVSALICFEDHTQLMKVIYRDHAPMACYANLLIESYVRIIDLHNELEETEKADSYQEELIALMKSLLIAYPKEEFYLNSLAACYEALAERRVEQEKPNEALTFYLQSLSYNEALTPIEPSPGEYVKHRLAILKKLTKLYTHIGDYQSAERYQNEVNQLNESQ